MVVECGCLQPILYSSLACSCFVVVRPNNVRSALRVRLASGLVLLVLADALDVFSELFFVEPNFKERIIGEAKYYRVQSFVITVARLLRQVVSADWLRPILAAQLIVSVLDRKSVV